MGKLSWIGFFGLTLSLLTAQKAVAGTFNVGSEVTFEVIDGGFGPDAVFDGKGEPNEVFPGNFDISFLGTLGEASQHAEFNLNNLAIFQKDLKNLPAPASEVITQVIFRIKALPNEVFGLGTSGKTQGLAVRAYVGNGQPDAADFQAGSIVGTASLSPDPIEEILDFDVTDFITQALNDGVDYAGFSVRAQTLGGVLLERNPTLVVNTKIRPVQDVPEPSSALGILALTALGVSYSRSKFKPRLS